MRISDWSSDVCSSGLVDLVGQVDEPCEVTGAHHGCLVADDHRAVGDAEPAVPDVAEELGDGVGGDAAVGVQAGGRSGGEELVERSVGSERVCTFMISVHPHYL